MIKDTDTFAMFARMRSVDAIVRSALSKKQFVSSSSRENEDNEDVDKIKAAAMDELQRTALRLLSLLENKGTKFHEKLCTITLNDGDGLDDVEKKKYADKTRRDYIDVFLKKIFLKAEESGCLRDDFAEKHAERLLAAASLASETERREDGGDEGNAMTMTKKMFVYENGTIQETGETFDEAPFDEGDSPYENLSEITLSLSTNLFAGNTGAHEWTAGFKLAELAINEPGLVYNKTVLELGSGAGLAAVAMLRSQPLRLVLTDKCKESNDNLEKNVRENIFSGIGSSNSSSSSSDDGGERSGFGGFIASAGYDRTLKIWK